MNDKYQYAKPSSRRMGTNPRVVKPYLRRNMERPALHGQDNLCSTIRDIYIKSTDEEVRLWCRIAMRMSKNMYLALTRYNRMLKEAGIDTKETRNDWQEKHKP